jgi:hypothetical protein
MKTVTRWWSVRPPEARRALRGSSRRRSHRGWAFEADVGEIDVGACGKAGDRPEVSRTAWLSDCDDNAWTQTAALDAFNAAASL